MFSLITQIRLPQNYDRANKTIAQDIIGHHWHYEHNNANYIHTFYDPYMKNYNQL